MSEQSPKPTLQEKMLALYAEGADDSEVAALLDLPKERYLQLYEENPAFKKIIDIGRTKAEAWWNNVARRNLLTKGWQGATWAMNMKNRFKWADKMDIGERLDGSPHDAADLEAEIKRTMQRIQKVDPKKARAIMEAQDD